MFGLFKKKQEEESVEFVPTVVYPDNKTPEEWAMIETFVMPEVNTPKGSVALQPGKLFSIHQPYPFTDETLIKAAHKKWVIEIAKQQCQERFDNYLPFRIV